MSKGTTFKIWYLTKFKGKKISFKVDYNLEPDLYSKY